MTQTVADNFNWNWVVDSLIFDVYKLKSKTQATPEIDCNLLNLQRILDNEDTHGSLKNNNSFSNTFEAAPNHDEHLDQQDNGEF